MSETVHPPASASDGFLSLNSAGPTADRADGLTLLAARNSTLRLRGPSGHVFSFTDLTSAGGLVNFGHLNPAMDLPADSPSDLAPGFYPPAAAAHATWLCANLGLTDHTVLYRCGRQAAVYAAVAMAQQARPGKVLTIEGSSHGLPPLPGNVETLRPGAEFTAWDHVSCLIYEPMQSDAGYVPLPLPWLRGICQAAQAAGVCVIVDETGCGFYRFGKLSLAASEFLRPDVYFFGNSMTNGAYPLFAVVHPRALLAADRVSGFETSATGFASAEAVARYIDTTDVEAQVAAINRLLNRAGESLAANPALTAFHLAGPTLSLEVRDARAASLARACRAAGVLIGVCETGLRVQIAPPITIPKDQLRTALKAIETAATAL